MIPSNNYWRAQFTRADHFVKSKAEAVAVAQSNPANTRGKALKLNLRKYLKD